MAIAQQISIDAQLVIEKMEEKQIGEIMTYDEMTALIHRDVREHRSIIDTAIRTLLRKSIAFCVVPKVGYERIDDVKKVEVAGSNFQRVGRVIKKSIKMLGSVEDFDALPNEAKIKHNSILSMCGAIKQFTGSIAQKKIESVLLENNRVMPVSETLKQFSV